MNEYLLCGRFKWLKTIHKFYIMSISEKGPIGYFKKLTLNILMNYMNYIMIFH